MNPDLRKLIHQHSQYIDSKFLGYNQLQRVAEQVQAMVLEQGLVLVQVMDLAKAMGLDLVTDSETDSETDLVKAKVTYMVLSTQQCLRVSLRYHTINRSQYSTPRLCTR